MNSKGRLYAFDVSEKRLNNLIPRFKRSGLSNLHIQRINDENDSKVKRLSGKIDRVLVDAPCSGIGTLRRNPDLKWRQSSQSIEELKAKFARAHEGAERKKIASDIQAVVFETASYVPLGEYRNPTVMRNNVSGLLQTPGIPVMWGLAKR